MNLDPTVADQLLREVDALLRVIAQDDCPPGTSRIAFSFSELKIPPVGSVCGFVHPKLHQLAADVLRDPALVGRPVFAIDVDRLAPMRFDDAVASARSTAMHELAHAVALPCGDGSIDTLIASLTASLSSPSLDVLDPKNHDAAWWRRYMTLAARLDYVALQLVPTREIEAASRLYGFSRGATASQWIAAASATPGLHAGPIAEVAARACPAFDQLIDNLASDSVSAAPAPPV